MNIDVNFTAIKVIIFCLFLTLYSNLAHALDNMKFQLPIDCKLDQDCWIVNYVDLDSTSGRRTFFCGHQTYNGHKGTDFAIRDLTQMGEGVAVKAVFKGTVLGTRDGMPDISLALVGHDAIGGRECGNGLVVEHPNGWETQYCHLRQGSIAVNKGDVIKAGTHLGFVGQSGAAEFPHVHLSVRHNGKIIDPFIKLSPHLHGSNCVTDVTLNPSISLWQNNALSTEIPEPTIIQNIGFSGIVPTANATRAGLYADVSIPVTAPVLAIWTDILWVEIGDRIKVQIINPDGTLLIDHAIVQDKTQARRWMFVGKKLKEDRWQEGEYIGEVSVRRNSIDGEMVSIQSRRYLVMPE